MPGYDEIIEGNDEALQRRVLAILQAAKPQPVTRERLVRMALGCERGDRGYSTADRQVRAAVASLLLRGYPVISSSGEAGYHLTDDPEEVKQAIAEVSSRMASLGERLRALRSVRVDANRAW